MAISGPTSGSVGDRIELTCTVTTVAHLSPDAELTVTWSGGNGGDSRVMESETVAVSGTTSERNLSFNFLNTSHGAQYTCQAVINISLIGLMKIGTVNTDLRIKSELVPTHTSKLLLCLYLSLLSLFLDNPYGREACQVQVVQ